MTDACPLRSLRVTPPRLDRRGYVNPAPPPAPRAASSRRGPARTTGAPAGTARPWGSWPVRHDPRLQLARTRAPVAQLAKLVVERDDDRDRARPVGEIQVHHLGILVTPDNAELEPGHLVHQLGEDGNGARRVPAPVLRDDEQPAPSPGGRAPVTAQAGQPSDRVDPLPQPLVLRARRQKRRIGQAPGPIDL